MLTNRYAEVVLITPTKKQENKNRHELHQFKTPLVFFLVDSVINVNSVLSINKLVKLVSKKLNLLKN